MRTTTLSYPLALLTTLAIFAPGCFAPEQASADAQNGSSADGVDSSAGGGTSGNGGSAASSDTAATTSPGGTGGSDEPDPEPDPEDPGEEGSSSSGTSTGEPACDDQTAIELYLSPDDSNSMSSPVQVRSKVLSAGSSIAGAPIRVWEFLNYYSFDYPAAEPGTLALHTSLLHEEDAAPGEFKLQIAITSPAMDNADRAKMNLTLVLDESGSMTGAPMSLQQETCRVIASSLRSGDIVSIVGWDTSNAIKLAGHQAVGPNDPVIVDACDGLSAGGGTDLHGGLLAGYELAEEYYDNSRINRIVLMSDGGANAGVTDEELIAQHAGSQNQDGIYMVGVGVGEGDYNDLLMDHVTDIGKGASVFIDSIDEAHKVFGDRFVSTMAVAARDVQIQLDMPPGFEIVKFSGEEFSAVPEEIEPQHIAPNDAMVFHQTISTCAPELAGEEAEITVTARFLNAVTFEAQEVTHTVTIGAMLEQSDPQLLKGAAVFAYAEGLKLVRDEGDTSGITAAQTAIERAEEVLPGDADLAEMRSVLEAI
ncbi:MAG: VWA domain-containing protein [Nannocystaceae bacterium]|nr:VWA domain-containing protein [Nannocystaceae bacterium]